MSDARKCDRCGRYYGTDTTRTVAVDSIPIEGIDIGMVKNVYRTFRCDLCEECTEELLKFMHILPDPKPFRNKKEKEELKDTARPDVIAAVIRNIEKKGGDGIFYLSSNKNLDLTLIEKDMLIRMYDPNCEHIMLNLETGNIEPVGGNKSGKDRKTKETGCKA